MNNSDSDVSGAAGDEAVCPVCDGTNTEEIVDGDLDYRCLDCGQSSTRAAARSTLSEKRSFARRSLHSLDHLTPGFPRLRILFSLLSLSICESLHGPPRASRTVEMGRSDLRRSEPVVVGLGFSHCPCSNRQRFRTLAARLGSGMLQQSLEVRQRSRRRDGLCRER